MELLGRQLAAHGPVEPEIASRNLVSIRKETSLYKGYKGNHPLDVETLKDVMRDMERKIRASANIAEGEQLWGVMRMSFSK